IPLENRFHIFLLRSIVYPKSTHQAALPGPVVPSTHSNSRPLGLLKGNTRRQNDFSVHLLCARRRVYTLPVLSSRFAFRASEKGFLQEVLYYHSSSAPLHDLQ